MPHMDVARPFRLLRFDCHIDPGIVPIREVVVAHADRDTLLPPVQCGVGETRNHHRRGVRPIPPARQDSDTQPTARGVITAQNACREPALGLARSYS